jgi:hypothetical protein
MKTFTFLLMMCIATIGIVQAQDFPIDFETGTYTFTDFDGGATTVIDNAQLSGINTSAKVAQMIKSAGQVWGGSKLALSGTIDFTANQVFKMKVFSPRVGVPVLFKLENGDGSVFAEKAVPTTVANDWEMLSFDFSGSNSGVFNNLVFIFENGTMGDGSANWTFLFDDIEFIPSALPALVLPIDFEGGPYGFTDFDGGAATVIDNPQSSDINASATVAQIVRNGGATWGGSKLALNDKIDFSVGNAISMKVFSTRVGVPVLFKLEGDAQTEVSVNTTVANEWETLIWDFTGQPSGTFNTLVFMFDFGTVGDGSANSTFLFDDIEQVDNTGGLSQIDLPVSFEDETVNYAMSDFGGNVSVLGEDPSGATNTVSITTKTAGAETWAGTTIGTSLGFASVIPFTADKTKISMRVYSPAAGIQIRLKVEDHNDVTLTAETEATTTVANAWEELIFDFSQVADGTNPWNSEINFDKMSVFFDFGNNGTGAIYYFDDVTLGNETHVNIIEKYNINIYSNMGIIHVNSNDRLVQGTIDVYELSGKKIVSKTITDSNEELAISSKGIFVVRVSDENKFPVVTRKIVIN